MNHFKFGCACARFGSNFNTPDDPPALIVQIPIKGQQGDLVAKLPLAA